MSLAAKVEQIHRLAHRFWMKNGADIGLSYSEFEYLAAIKEQAILAETGHHGQHLHDLVSAMGVNKASASAMMDKLEKRKLVRVKPCKRDARAKHFILNKKGEELLAKGQTAYAQFVEAESEALDAYFDVSKAPKTEKAKAAASKPKKAEPSKPKKSEAKEAPEAAEEKPKELPQLSLFG
jgi:DNA-binding MarR family transcriptional regulator